VATSEDTDTLAFLTGLATSVLASRTVGARLTDALTKHADTSTRAVVVLTEAGDLRAVLAGIAFRTHALTLVAKAAVAAVLGALLG